MITPPKIIIEVDVKLTEEEKSKLINVLSNKIVLIKEHKVRVYETNEYIFKSEFSRIIYEEYGKENAFQLEY